MYGPRAFWPARRMVSGWGGDDVVVVGDDDLGEQDEVPGIDPETATRTATLVIATIRGLLLDLLATGDRGQVQDAAESFLDTLARRLRSSSPALPR